MLKIMYWNNITKFVEIALWNTDMTDMTIITESIYRIYYEESTHSTRLSVTPSHYMRGIHI